MSSATSTSPGLQSWQFFVLAGLGCATAAVVMARGQGVVTIVLLGVTLLSVILVGIAALRTLRPLVTDQDDRTAFVGHRTRAALEREKMLVLRTIKELEFDRAMGKLAENDWHEMSSRLRARAARLMRDLDAGSGYREQIERDPAKRLAESGSRSKASRPGSATAAADRTCAKCATANDADARFCKSCGGQL